MKATWTLAEAARAVAGAGAEPVQINRWVQFLSLYPDVLAIAPNWHRDEDGKVQARWDLNPAHRRVNRRHFQSWADAMGLPSGSGRRRGVVIDPPTMPTLRIAVATGTERWTLDAAAETTSRASWPKFEPAAEGYITVLGKAGLNGSLATLDSEDSAKLESIWAGLPPLELPIAKAEWKVYEDAFGSSPKRPLMWTLQPEVCEPATALGRRQAIAEREHLTKLLGEIAAGRIAAYHPQKGTRARPGDARIDNTYLVRLDGIASLCGVLGIYTVGPAERDRLPCIRDEAMPEAMPPGLVGLDNAELVLREPGYGSKGRAFICTVGDFRSDVEGRMQRQKEKGQFTFDEAVQVLADARPEIDEERFQALLRDALTARDELKAVDGADRLPLLNAETVVEDFDLLTAAQLDAWLQKMGYRFPPAAAAHALAHVALHSGEAPALHPATQAGQLAPRPRHPDESAPQWQQAGQIQSPQEVGASQAVAKVVVRHSTKGRRRDSIDIAIERVRPQCRDPKDTAEVWMHLQDAAQQEEKPFLGVFPQGLKYLKDGGEETYFTRAALDKRLHPEKRQSPRKPPHPAA